MRVVGSLSVGLIVGALTLAGLLADVSSARADEAEDVLIRGDSLYTSKCSSCHGLDGRGMTPLAELFHGAPPDLTRIAVRRGGWFPDAVVREIIDGRYGAHGERKMPVWGGTLSQLEMIAITEHLYAFQVPVPVAPK